MWKLFKKLCHDCLTENDGKSYDAFRLGGAALTVTSIPTFIWATIYQVLHEHGHFDYQGFGIAFGGICAGMGVLAAGVSVKARTDQIGNPSSPSPPTGTP
jgi:hypothetical protein